MATINRTTASYSRQAPIDQALTRLYTLNWVVIAWAALFVLAVATRFYDLGARVMSHDESLHTYYSWELYDFGKFEHTPLMHGPVLFHAVAFFYFLFGPSDFSARLYPAILGVGMVMFPLLFQRWMGRLASILAGVGLLISPMILYYNRYIREDTPNMFFMLVMVYGFMQYVDGKKPRQPVWMGVFAGGMLLMLASKEVGFMYIAIFGSFLTLYWVLRMLQDAYRHMGKHKREIVSEESNGKEIEYISSQPPTRWLVALGALVLLAFAAVLGYALGAVAYEFYHANRGFLPEGMSNRVFELIGIIFFALLFAIIGLLYDLINTQKAGFGLSRMVANGLRNTGPTLMLVTAGAVLGGVMALWSMSILDIIKPNTIFAEVRELDNVVDIVVNEAELNHFIEWAMIPPLFLLLGVILIGAFKRTPWQDILGVILIALVFMTVLLFVERHSHPSQEALTGPPVAIDPNAESSQAATEYNNIFIYASWMFCGVILMIVLFTRLLTNWWEFMNRQPVFDVLIVMGTLIFPWLSAFPLFWAGYVLDKAPELPTDTIEAAILTVIPFLLVSAATGLAWNWRVWPIALAVFGGLFLIFFTTFFTNGYGVGTGLVGSLGYWLEQQDVRRGSQPQYYYLLVEMPIYEFLPMLLGILAGFASLSWLFEARGRAVPHQKASSFAAYQTADGEIIIEEEVVEVIGDPIEVAESARVGSPVAMASVASGALPRTGNLEDIEITEEDELSGNGSEGDDEDWQVSEDWTFNPALDLPDWAQPYDHERELAQRNGGDTSYLGGIPFIQLLGYWAITIIAALTIAGEKMPWLSTHLTLPLILVGGWYTAHVVEGLSWDAIRRSGWIMLLFVMPVFFIALAEVALPLMTGRDVPFQGQLQTQLAATGKWLAALIVTFITGYFALRLSVEVGYGQARRLIFAAFIILLAGLTMRAAWKWAFINYDYATEFGVYAHAGPAPKEVLADLEFLAAHHPDGMNMKIAYDDDSSWPMLWYLRDFTNKVYFWGSPDEARQRAPDFEGAVAVIVGNRKNAEIEAILGKDYYRFDLIRLWWPMQEYFNLNYQRISNIFQSDVTNPAASLYRKGMWDIWWARNYDRYEQAMCLEERVRLECSANVVPDEGQQHTCVQNLRVECERTADRFNVEKWPVSDELFLYVRKDFAVQIWDAGLNGLTVQQRLIPDPEDEHYQEMNASLSFGSGLLNQPRGLATLQIDNDQLVYVADSLNNRIAVFNSQGEFIQQLGGYSFVGDDGITYYVPFSSVEPILMLSQTGEVLQELPPLNQSDRVTDAEGNIYIVDLIGNHMTMTSSDGQLLRDMLGQSFLKEPWGVAISPVNNNVYVADTWNHRVVIFTSTGQFVAAFGEFGTPDTGLPYAFYGPRAVTVDKEGSIYVSDTGGHRIRVYNQNLVFVRDITAQGDGLQASPEPVGIAVHPTSGEIYVAETWNQQISVFRRDGTFVFSWKVNMWAGTRESRYRPYLAISPDGTLVFVSDMDATNDNNGPRVVAYDLRGNAVLSFNAPLILTTDNAGGPSGVEVVGGLAFGSQGEIYVADATTSRVVVFPPFGISGSLSPVADPTYGVNQIGSTIDLSDTEAVQQVGFVYWQSLSIGDFNLYQSLYCAEDLALPDFPIDQENFLTYIAGPYLNTSTNELQVFPTINADTATIDWGGFLIYRPATDQESRAGVEDYMPLSLVKQNGVWKICSSVHQPADNDIFRPGGG